VDAPHFLRERGGPCTRLGHSPVVQVDPGVQEDAQALVDQAVEAGQALAHAQALVDLALALGDCFLQDLVKLLQLVAQPEDPHRDGVATSVTRRARKAR
jgi:hypothetical protein